jgi:hypothetical protein
MTSSATRHINASIWAPVLYANGKYPEAVIGATVGSSLLLVMSDVKQNHEHL